MLVKRSSKNQIALPKAVLERAGLGPDDVYFDVDCDRGRILLIPVTIEEKIPPEAIARFEAKNRKREYGDRDFASMDAALAHLRKIRKRR